MLAINNQQQKNIRVPDELLESILKLLGTLLETLKAEDTQSIPLAASIMKSLFDISDCLKQVQGEKHLYHYLLNKRDPA